MVNVYYVAHFEMRKNNYAIQINDIYDQIYLVYWECFSFSFSTMGSVENTQYRLSRKHSIS
jgi:hypothetical protein